MTHFLVSQLSHYAADVQYMVSHEEFRLVASLVQFYDAEVLQRQVLRCGPGGECGGRAHSADCAAQCSALALLCVQHIRYALGLVPHAVLQQTARYPDMVRAMTASLSPSASYLEVHARRSEWLAQRVELQNGLESSQAARVRVHYVTYASHHTDDLETLLISAKLSGVDLTVSVCVIMCYFAVLAEMRFYVIAHCRCWAWAFRSPATPTK